MSSVPEEPVSSPDGDVESLSLQQLLKKVVLLSDRVRQLENQAAAGQGGKGKATCSCCGASTAASEGTRSTSPPHQPRNGAQQPAALQGTAHGERSREAGLPAGNSGEAALLAAGSSEASPDGGGHPAARDITASAAPRPVEASHQLLRPDGGGHEAMWRPQHSTQPPPLLIRRLPSIKAAMPAGASAAEAASDDGTAVPMAATRVVANHLVLPTDSNALGISTGGQVLGWVDICAGLAARMLARSPCVTASVDSVHFLRPCRVGSVMLVAAMVNRTFKSSMEVGVRVEEEDSRTGERHHCCSAYLTFVSLAARPSRSGGGARLPRVTPTSARHEEVFDAARARREQRLAHRKVRSDAADAPLLPVTHAESLPSIPPLMPASPRKGAKRPIAPAYTTARMTQLIMPQHANSIGITFGGQVMRWMEQCVYIAGSRVARGSHLVTASMDSIAFQQPTKVGHVLYVTAQVTAIFGSSLEAMISVHGEDPDAGVMFDCGNAFATVVSVGEDGLPLDIPYQLQPRSEAEAQRMRAATDRRLQRLRLRSTLLDQAGQQQQQSGDEELLSQERFLAPLARDARD